MTLPLVPCAASCGQASSIYLEIDGDLASGDSSVSPEHVNTARRIKEVLLAVTRSCT